MYDHFVQKLVETLEARVAVSSIRLITEQLVGSFVVERTVEIECRLTDGKDSPIALVHVFPMDDGETCELEVEVSFPVAQITMEPKQFWDKAKEIYDQVAIKSYQRYFGTETEPTDAEVMLEYSKLVEIPDDPQFGGSELCWTEFLTEVESLGQEIVRFLRLTRYRSTT